MQQHGLWVVLLTLSSTSSEAFSNKKWTVRNYCLFWVPVGDVPSWGMEPALLIDCFWADRFWVVGLVVVLMESLILAQDERWRRA